MIVLLSFLGFAGVGWMRATRRGGNLADRIQYAIVHGTAAALVAMLLITIAGHLGLLD